MLTILSAGSILLQFGLLDQLCYKAVTINDQYQPHFNAHQVFAKKIT